MFFNNLVTYFLECFLGKFCSILKGCSREIGIFPESYSAFCHNFLTYYTCTGRRGGLMVSALDSGASGPGSSPGRGQCVVFLGKTLYSHSASLHPGV